MILIPFILAAVYAGGHYLLYQSWQQTLLLVVGMVIGFAFYLLDAKVFVKYYTDPGEPLHPVTQSLWMLILYWPLAIFVATSTGSLLGMGLMLALGLHLTWDVLRNQATAAQFKTFFNVPQRSQLNDRDVQIAAGVWVVAFVILAASYLW